MGIIILKNLIQILSGIYRWNFLLREAKHNSKFSIMGYAKSKNGVRKLIWSIIPSTLVIVQYLLTGKSKFFA